MMHIYAGVTPVKPPLDSTAVWILQEIGLNRSQSCSQFATKRQDGVKIC